MFHVRIASPPDVTGRLVETLAADPGVKNLVVLPGAARRPDGDAVQFDLRTGSANPVFRQLRDLELDGRGVVCVGILTNSQILVVGAMVVGPEYSAIIAVALGIERHRARPVRRGLLALLGGFATAIAASVLFGIAIRWSGHTPEAFVAGVRPVAALINRPNLFSVIVAVLAGLVGVVSLTEARAGALIGVFISVTTIPAAAALGLSLAYQDWMSAGGSAEQLLLNVVLLIVVGVAALRLQRIIWRSRGR